MSCCTAITFKECGGSLPPIHKFTIGPYVQQDPSSLQDHNPPPANSSLHLRLGLPKRLLLSGFPTKALYAFLDCSIRATCPAHLSRLDLRDNTGF